MASRYIECNSRKILRRLRNEGWVVVNIEGSHHKMKHPDRLYPIVVPHPKRDLPIGTARAIAKAAGWLEKS